ncbi:hypothetical protein GOODEAATRI_032619 [Goodea atripinnis]|uniref:Uncharacterized protein n=1 Tax=Goodea atripinnis TaxID=208336 RepID=A0ABV0NZL1_9TELE
MQDLTKWGINDHEEGEGSAQNYTAGPSEVPEELGPRSQRRPLVTHYAAMDYNPAVFPCSSQRMSGPVKFTNDHLDDLEEEWEKAMWSDETEIELFGLNVQDNCTILRGGWMGSCIGRM